MILVEVRDKQREGKLIVLILDFIAQSKGFHEGFAQVCQLQKTHSVAQAAVDDYDLQLFFTMADYQSGIRFGIRRSGEKAYFQLLGISFDQRVEPYRLLRCKSKAREQQDEDQK